MKKQLFRLSFLVIGTLANAQIGIRTPNPLGIFHVDGNRDNATNPTTAQQANDFIITSNGDIGIGTTTINPSAKLQIDANNKGLLLPRVALTSPSDNTTIPSPAKGLIVYNTVTNSNIEEGFYTNYGTATAPVWRTFQQRERSAWEFSDFYDATATQPVDQVTNGGNTVNNINLGLSVTITVPAFSQAKLLTNYSVPMGTLSPAPTLSGYYGIRFLKNGTEFPAGSRKQGIQPPYASILSRMTSITASVGETITNNTASPINVTYTLNGYIEPMSDSTSATIRFNMWSTSEPNFNWGRAYMGVQVLLKSTL